MKRERPVFSSIRGGKDRPLALSAPRSLTSRVETHLHVYVSCLPSPHRLSGSRVVFRWAFSSPSLRASRVTWTTVWNRIAQLVSPLAEDVLGPMFSKERFSHLFSLCVILCDDPLVGVKQGGIPLPTIPQPPPRRSRGLAAVPIASVPSPLYRQSRCPLPFTRG